MSEMHISIIQIYNQQLMRKKEFAQDSGTSEWAIGTKHSGGPQKKPQEEVKQQQMRHVPKLKGRNPFHVLRQLTGSDESIPDAATINQESISLLSQFNIPQFSISDFISEIFKLNDSRGFTNNDVIEYILSQSKIRDLFSRLNKPQTAQIIEVLLKSIRINSSFENKGQCIRMLGHLLYEDNEIDNPQLEAIYKDVGKIAFDQQNMPQTLQSDASLSATGSVGESSQNNQAKLQRLAINCLANLFLKPSPYFMKGHAEIIYLKLKSVFDLQMRKIQFNFRSKRFISTLTTVIRGLQLSMNEMLTNQKLQINDNECIKLFLSFYKLLFLGSIFAEKMLNIKFEESKSKKGAKTVLELKEETLEELKQGDSGSAMIIDTSDISSQSDSGIYSKNSPSESGGEGGDHYQKVKNYAVLCLQYLFKSNSKTLFNYWYLLFPSHFMKPQSEFTPYLQSFEEKKPEFYEKINQIVKREPTLFYLMKASENNNKLKSTICFTISLMLENSLIQKQQGHLEQQQQQVFVQMENILGQFLRFLHYQLAYMIQSEYEAGADQSLLCQFIKTTGIMIHSTPYQKMNKGLIGSIIHPLQLMIFDSELDPQTKLAIINTIAIAMNLNDLKSEIAIDYPKLISYLTSTSELSIQHSNETLTLLQRIAKNYPEWFLGCFPYDFFSRLLFKTPTTTVEHRKKIISSLKILEEWLKNYKQGSVKNDDDDQEEEVKSQDSHQSPYLNEELKQLLNCIIDSFVIKQGSQGLQSDIIIAILSILNNLDATQWRQVFSPEITLNQILNGFIYQASMQPPPLLKAASIKQLGYMAYFDIPLMFSGYKGDSADNLHKKFLQKTYQIILNAASDTNLNVQIRNSWTLANMSFVNKASLLDEYLAQEILIISIQYALSNKEKVASNGLRSLGYYLQNINMTQLKDKFIAQINKSQQMLHRIPLQTLSIDSLIGIILENLDSKFPKLAWNACVALANILDNPSLQGNEVIFSQKSLKPLIKALEQSQNFKTKIHAATTLMKFGSYNHGLSFKADDLYHNTWLSIVNTLEQHNQAVYSTQDQKKYVQNIDNLIFNLWNQMASLLSKDFIEQMKAFVNQNGFIFLQTVSEYLRKELKVPKYSEMYDDKDQFNQETKSLFLENPNLEQKLIEIRNVIRAVRDTIKGNEDVHVSFGVFESLHSLAEENVMSFRSLECLKVQRTSFMPSFDDEAPIKKA